MHTLWCHPLPRVWEQQRDQYLHQFVLHAALDAVDEVQWTTKELHLKVRVADCEVLWLLDVAKPWFY
jgi:hypothetical protein